MWCAGSPAKGGSPRPVTASELDKRAGKGRRTSIDGSATPTSYQGAVKKDEALRIEAEVAKKNELEAEKELEAVAEAQQETQATLQEKDAQINEMREKLEEMTQLQEAMVAQKEEEYQVAVRDKEQALEELRVGHEASQRELQQAL